MTLLEDKLKNPIWYSLQETHSKFCININGVRFYNPVINNFGAFTDGKKTEEAITKYSHLSDSFFLVSENQAPTFNTNKVILHKKIEGCQMVLYNFQNYDANEEIIQLNHKHIHMVYELIWKVMPGFYQKKGFEMGKFFGIFKQKKLVAICGQRMQTDNFIEISSVVTDPNFTKRGFAKQLISHMTKTILDDQKTPILHTNKGNLAIPLYKNLGYKITRDMNWWSFKRK